MPTHSCVSQRANGAAILLTAMVLSGGTASHAFAEELVAPKAQLPLRAQPPGTFFQGKGAQIGEARPNERYRILDRKTVPTIVGAEQWLRVQSATDPNKSGWIYGGSATEPTVIPLR